VLGWLAEPGVSCFSLEGPDDAYGRRFGNIGLVPLVRGALRAYIGGSSYRVRFRFVEDRGKEADPGVAALVSVFPGVVTILSAGLGMATSFVGGGFGSGEELYCGEAGGTSAWDDLGVFG
jgi:hypothetical protein